MQKNQKKKTPVILSLKGKQKKVPVQKETVFTILQPLLFILPIVFIAFFPILNNELTNWDDPDLIIDNMLIRDFSFEGIRKIFTTFYFGNFQPLHLLSYSVEYHFWQLNPAGYHAVSLVMFLITTALVYYFIYQISNKNKIVAIIATLLFAINAMRVESVAWASERKDMLYAMFYMASLIAYVKYIIVLKEPVKRLKIKYIVYAFLFFILAVFSKVMAVSIVGPMVMLDYFYARKFSMRLILEKIPYVIVSLIIGLAQIMAVASAGTIDKSNLFSFTDRLLIVCRNLMFYFYKILIPVNLSAFNPYPSRAPGIPWPAEFFISLFFVLILLALLIWSFRKTRIIIFCTGFFVATLALVLQYVAIGPTMFNERYSLIPSVALSFALASGIFFLVSRFPDYKNIFYGATGLYLVLMFYLTFTRCDVWQTSLTLWDDAINQFPHASIPLNGRGKYYGMDLGDRTKAIEDFTASIRYNPEYEDPYSNRGIVYCLNGKLDSAIIDFNTAIGLKKDNYKAIANRGIAYAQTNRPELALNDFDQCIRLKPEKYHIYLNRGICYIQLNKPEKALVDFNKGIEINPTNAEFYLRRSQAWYNLGKYADAYRDVQTARNSGINVDNAYFDQLKKAAAK
ncbi:MAG: tetratricopeptide repeat protein [Bacteroidetes bacterium]|nr:tetratricopeptide repeat protein [Bacteroidota bacterium]